MTAKRLVLVSFVVALSLSLLSGIALAQTTNYVNAMDTAKMADELSTFVAAVEAAGLDDKLNNGQYTIFAPTNEAFAKLPEGKLDRLLLPENKQKLIEILTYHVIPVRLSVDDFREGKSYKTLNGHLLNVLFTNPPILVNKKISVITSLAASNAIIYFVDMVILPPEGKPAN